MYSKQRRALESRYRMRRVPRTHGCGAPRDYRHSHGPLEFNRGEYSHDLTKAQIASARKDLSIRFPNCLTDVLGYNGIDQGQNGACSFVALLNAMHLNGSIDLILNKRMAYLRRNWKKFWKAPLENDSSEDLGQTLDMMSSTLIKAHHAFVYVPIRSSGNREQSFNESIWITDTPMLQSRYCIPKGDYEKIPYVYQNAYFVENQIDMGIPVVINVFEHTRVAVGYSDTEILFADSWSKEYTEINSLGTSIAGFSYQDKWSVFTYMRDAVTFVDSDMKKVAPAREEESEEASDAGIVGYSLDLAMDRSFSIVDDSCEDSGEEEEVVFLKCVPGE